MNCCPALEATSQRAFTPIVEPCLSSTFLMLWVEKADDAGLDARIRKGNQAMFRLQNKNFDEHHALLREIIHQAVREAQV
jgi:hypothetical protein